MGTFRQSWLAVLMAGQLAGIAPVWGDIKSFEEILLKQQPLQQDASGRGARLAQVVEEHKRQKPPLWEKDIQALQGLAPLELLGVVQELVNQRIKYQDDPFNIWLPPAVAYAEGGDCEDYASTKLLLLKESGFPEEALRIVVLAPVRFNSPYHVVLLARVDGRIYVLDSPNRAQSRGAVLLENFRETDRPVVWAGWPGGFAFSGSSLGKQPVGYPGLLLPRNPRLARLVGGEDRLLLVAADLRVISRRERPLNEAERLKLRNLRAYFNDPIAENARRINAAEARKLDSFRNLRR